MRSSGLVLLMCAGLLLSGGIILGGSTTWSLLRMSYYFWASDLGVELSATILYVAGALLCLPACWLATLVPYHPRSQALMATLMFVTTASLLMLSTGLSATTALSRAVRSPDALNASMMHAMAHDTHSPAVRSAFASMQLELKCCGVSSYTDWLQFRQTLPPACCNRIWNGKRVDQCHSPVHTSGCLRPALYELRAFVNSVTALSSAMIIVMAVTLFATAYILVCGVVERGEGRAVKTISPMPLRVSCLGVHVPPAHIQPRPAPAPPLVALTSPVVLPNTEHI